MRVKAENVFYEIKNIIHSMSQQCITELTLLSDVFSFMDAETLIMIKTLGSDLNDNQIIIDSLVFDLLSNSHTNKMNFEILWFYLGVADKLENIGNCIINVSYHIKMMLPYFQDFEDMNKIEKYNKRVIDVLSFSMAAFLDDGVIDVCECLKINKDLESQKDILLCKIIENMKDNAGGSFFYSELLFVIKDLYRIGVDSVAIIEKKGELQSSN